MGKSEVREGGGGANAEIVALAAYIFQGGARLILSSSTHSLAGGPCGNHPTWTYMSRRAPGLVVSLHLPKPWQWRHFRRANCEKPSTKSFGARTSKSPTPISTKTSSASSDAIQGCGPVSRSTLHMFRPMTGTARVSLPQHNPKCKPTNNSAVRYKGTKYLVHRITFSEHHGGIVAWRDVSHSVYLGSKTER
jgi:hypothetical protein